MGGPASTTWPAESFASRCARSSRKASGVTLDATETSATTVLLGPAPGAVQEGAGCGNDHPAVGMVEHVGEPLDGLGRVLAG